METWLQLAPKKQSQTMIHPFINFTVRDLPLSKNVQKHYSILTQFMIGLAIKDRDGATSLYLEEEGISSEMIKEVLAHFDHRQGVYQDGKLTEIVLSKPNRDSELSIRLRKIHPIIDDLFIFSDKKVEQKWRPIQRYKVLPEYISRYDDEAFDEVLHFLQNTSKEHSRLLSIKRWKVNEYLKKNVALQYFVHHCPNVYLWIDDVNETSLLELELPSNVYPALMDSN